MIMTIICLLILISLSLFSVYPSFSLGLYGDDWLEFWRFIYTTDSKNFGGYIGHLFSRYGSFDLIMGALMYLFKFESFYYYFTAYLLRLIASLSFFPLVLYITKNKAAAFLAVIFFSVTSVGLDVTNWVFNMPVYISITFLNLFFYFLVKSKFEKNDKLFGISLIFFVLAVLASFIRMTGLIPAVIFLYIFWAIKNRSRVSLQKKGKQLLSIILVFSLVILLGNSIMEPSPNGVNMVGTLENWINIGRESFNTMLSMLNRGEFEFIFYPFLMIGNMIFPIILTEANKLPLIISGFLLFVLGFIILKFQWKNELISTGIVLSLSWLVFSFFLGWVRTPDTIFPHTHRYFIVSVVGLTIFISILIAISQHLLKILIVGFFALLLILNIYSSRQYLNDLVINSHGAEITNKIWKQIPYIPEIGKTTQPLIFYFEGQERGIMHGAITFGFPYHIGVLYELDDYYKMPLPMDEWKSLVSAVNDGNSLIPYGYQANAVPIENIYAFRLEGKDNLINITEEIRQRLRETKQ